MDPRRPSPVRQQQREQTRGRLVEAALRVFSLHGYDHSTVEEISLAAGHSKGAYYFHFDSKEGIFLELLSDWIDEQTRRLSVRETAGAPPAATLIETLDSLLRYDDRDPHWVLLLPEFWAQAHRNERVQEQLQRAYRYWLALLGDLFEKSEREGVLSLAVRPEIGASLMLALHDGIVVHWRLHPARRRDPMTRQILGALVSLLSRPEAATVQAVVPPARRRTVHRRS